VGVVGGCGLLGGCGLTLSLQRYEPVDMSGGRKEIGGGPHFTTSQRMVLDDITLANLDVVDHPGQQDSSLLQRLDHCSTPFGMHTHTHTVPPYYTVVVPPPFFIGDIVRIRKERLCEIEIGKVR
jgi:hypothetical protein